MSRQSSSRIAAIVRHLSIWVGKHSNDEMVRQAEALPLRRDMVTLLTYVRDNKVTGTQSTGNMPLKAVREVTARFVDPPKLESTIGNRTYQIRSEADVWPLYFLHILAEVGGLLVPAPSRRWRLTRRGKEFLTADPLLQVSLLLAIWWDQVNWLIAYPFAGMGEALPPYFEMTTLANLLSLPAGTRIPFETFADELIQETGLTWTAPNTRFARTLLHGSIARMVVHILANFGAVEQEYQDRPLGKGTISDLVAFQITPFGKGLLDAVAMVKGM